MTRRDQFAAAAVKLADIGFMTLGAVALWAFSTVVYYYGWTRQRQFSSFLYGALYYGCPLAILLLLAAARRLPSAYRINLFIVVVAVAGSLLAFELFMESRYYAAYTSTIPVMDSLAGSTDKSKDARELSRNWHVEVDIRTAQEVLASLRRDGIDAVPIITASNQLFLEQRDSVKSAIALDGREIVPLAGVSNKITVLCNENGQWIQYRSDQHGFNNPSEMWRRDHIEIVTLGDSFAHGYCVPTEKAFVPLIRRRYPATLNLGVSGDGPLLMLATLKEYLPGLRPNVVLWFYYEGNDLTDLQRERKSSLLTNYLTDGFTQSDLARQEEIDRAMLHEIPRLIAQEEKRRAEKRRNKVVGPLRDATNLAALRQRLGAAGGLDADESDRAADLEGPNMTVFRQVLVDAKATVDRWGGRLEFIYLPEWARYTSYTSWGKTRRDDVLAIVRDIGIPVIDIDQAFRAHGDPLSLFPFRKAGHYNEEGHRVVADAVLKAIDQRQKSVKAADAD